MKILALYSTRSLSVLRRVIAPLSTLANRGYSVSFMQVLEFDPGPCYSADLVILPNWVFPPEELAQLGVLAQQKTLIYDLSDPKLLANQSVQTAIQLANVVTVPNAYLEREVKGLFARAKVLPSAIDIPYFMTANKAPKPAHRFIGCFGPHDWHLVKEPIEAISAKKNIKFLGDAYSQAILGDLVIPVDVTPEVYPELIRSCLFGLLPMEGNTGQDTIWAHEYGILGKPVIASSDSPYSALLAGGRGLLVQSKEPERWESAIKILCENANLRAELGTSNHTLAKSQSAAILADQYWRAYGKLWPHLALVK